MKMRLRKYGRETAEARRADPARGGEINFTDRKIIGTDPLTAY